MGWDYGLGRSGWDFFVARQRVSKSRSKSRLALVVSVFFGLQAIAATVKGRLDLACRWREEYGKTSARISKYAFALGILVRILCGVGSDSWSISKVRKTTHTIVQQTRKRNLLRFTGGA